MRCGDCPSFSACVRQGQRTVNEDMSGLRQTTEARGASTSSPEDNVGEREHLFNFSRYPSEHIEAGKDTADQQVTRMGSGERLFSFFSFQLSILSPNYLISLCALFYMSFCTIKIGMCAACTTPSVDLPAQETEEKENKRPAKGAAALEQACWY